MATDDKTKDAPKAPASGDTKDNDELLTLKASVKDQGDQIVALKKENETLNAELKKRLDLQERRDKARQVRALILRGRSEGKLLPAELKDLPEPLLATECGEAEDLKLLEWFDKSENFSGNVHTLRFAVGRSVPMVSLDKTTSSGIPKGGTAALTEAEHQAIRERGHDPEIVAAMKSGATYRDFLAMKAKKTAAGGKKE